MNAVTATAALIGHYFRHLQITYLAAMAGYTLGGGANTLPFQIATIGGAVLVLGARVAQLRVHDRSFCGRCDQIHIVVTRRA